MPDESDRRAHERFPVNADTRCLFGAPVAEEFGPVKIKNVSMGGIGLLLSRRPEPGSLLVVTLANPAKNFSKTLLVRVAHVTPHLGTYLVGGSFDTPLTYQEMS